MKKVTYNRYTITVQDLLDYVASQIRPSPCEDPPEFITIEVREKKFRPLWDKRRGLYRAFGYPGYRDGGSASVITITTEHGDKEMPF